MFPQKDELTLEKIDFELILATNEPTKLRKIIDLLERDPYYPQLLQSAIDKLNTLGFQPHSSKMVSSTTDVCETMLKYESELYKMNKVIHSDHPERVFPAVRNSTEAQSQIYRPVAVALTPSEARDQKLKVEAALRKQQNEGPEEKTPPSKNAPASTAVRSVDGMRTLIG